MILNNDRCSDPRSTNPEYVEYPGKKYRARTQIEKIALVTWNQRIQDSLQSARQTGYCLYKKKIAIFIDGCFWHKCPICFQEPETRKEFWMKKIQSNVERDDKVNLQLKSDGWTVMRFWEHDVRKNPEAIVKHISGKIGINSRSDYIN